LPLPPFMVATVIIALVIQPSPSQLRTRRISRMLARSGATS
jgi:hypothetical protein